MWLDSGVVVGGIGSLVTGTIISFALHNPMRWAFGGHLRAACGIEEAAFPGEMDWGTISCIFRYQAL